ncbi:MAG: acetyl-CoA carboxylase biotin carboxyl carrier protein [Bacteroidota bacterium]
MELKEIQNLIKFVAKSGANEVKLETKDFKITIKTGGENKVTSVIQQVPVAPAQVPPQTEIQGAPAAEQQSKPVEEKTDEKTSYIEIKSPIIGTFYRKPSPDKPPFIKVGDNVEVGDTVCIIEAMKLFNEVESEISGKIVKILVDDSSPVEFDQPLYLVDPS